MLTEEEIIADGDEGASEIYDLRGEVAAYVAADIARAIVDVNRKEDDRRLDGVVKTHTIWNVPVYRKPLREDIIETLLARYYRPYHEKLSALAVGDVLLGLDCHTMVSEAPPVGPEPGSPRPSLCLSNAEGTCPDEWTKGLAGVLERAFGLGVAINSPFTGGYIIRSHAGELPWVQLEVSRGRFMSPAEKRARLLRALGEWCREVAGKQ
jgi:N-formylglutamate amidohydrolase